MCFSASRRKASASDAFSGLIFLPSRGHPIAKRPTAGVLQPLVSYSLHTVKFTYQARFAGCAGTSLRGRFVQSVPRLDSAIFWRSWSAISAFIKASLSEPHQSLPFKTRIRSITACTASVMRCGCLSRSNSRRAALYRVYQCE